MTKEEVERIVRDTLEDKLRIRVEVVEETTKPLTKKVTKRYLKVSLLYWVGPIYHPDPYTEIDHSMVELPLKKTSH